MNTTIKRKRAALLRQQAKTEAAMEILQIECRHPAPTMRYRGDNGNYDSSDDAYWIEWACPDCGKRWKTDQSREAVRMFPGAVEVKS